MAKTQLVNYHGYGVYVNYDVGYGPYFSNMIMHRIHRKMACNVVFTGEAGVGKSYMAMDTARVVEGKKQNGEDRFTIDQVVFTYKEFMDLVLQLRPGKIIVFDEPSYSMGKREWYKDLNKALVQTIESFRFKMHPLFIPIINKSLLDKTIRDHLIQYQVLVQDRGCGKVYRVQAGQFEERTYHAYLCELKHALFDKHLCDRDTCLSCSQLMQKNSDEYACRIFRAQYERKKASIQEERYEQARDIAEKSESLQLTMNQIENLALTVKDKFIDEDGKIDVQAMMIGLEDDYGIRLGHNRAYKLKRMLEIHHPELLNT